LTDNKYFYSVRTPSPGSRTTIQSF